MKIITTAHNMSMIKLVDAINAERWENENLDDARSQDQWAADRTDHNEALERISAEAEKLEAENAELKSQVDGIVDIIRHFFPDAYIFLSSAMFCA